MEGERGIVGRGAEHGAEEDIRTLLRGGSRQEVRY